MTTTRQPGEKMHLLARDRKSRCLDGIFRLKRIEDDSTLITPLRRCLTTLELTLLGIGATLGMANFVIIGNVTKNIAGSGTFLSFLIAGLIALLSAACFAEFAAQIPKAGSAYTYAYVVAGEFFAFIAGWNIILEYLLGIASIGIAFSGSLDHLVNNTISQWANDSLADLQANTVIAARPDIVAFCVVLLAGAFICIGATPSVISMCILTSINLVLTCFATILGFWFANSDNFGEQHTGGIFPFGANGVFAGAATCFYAFYGLDAITVAAEEAITPSNSVPFAIFSATAASTIIYFIMSLSLSFLVPYYGVDMTSAFSSAFTTNGIHWAGYVVGASSLISISASLIATSYTLPRIIYSMSSDGLFFEIFSSVNRTRQVPAAAVVVCAITAAMIAMFFDINFLYQFLSLGILVSYTIVAASIILHRYSPKDILTHKSDDPIEENLKAGQLKEQFRKFPILRNCEPGMAVSVAIFCLMVFSTGLWFLIRYGEKNLVAGNWWAWILFVLLLAGTILPVVTMYMHECKNNGHGTFQVPLVPLTPSLSIICNLFLLTKLTVANYLRFIIWMVIGLLIYFLYGIHHCKERKRISEDRNFLELSSDCDSDPSDMIGTASSLHSPQPSNGNKYNGDVVNLTHREKTNHAE